MPSLPILEALKSIPPTGLHGFEALAADLFSSLMDIPFRLCSAGLQDGVDALPSNEIPVSIEFKHYGKSRLNLRQLRGGLLAAVERYPSLQLWVLATTYEVSATHRKALRETGDRLGVGVLIVDKGSAGPELPSVSALEALCAINPVRFCQAINATRPKRGKAKTTTIDKAKVSKSLGAIAGSLQYKQWCERLKRDLYESPIWNIVVKRHNERLATIIRRGSQPYLGTIFQVDAVVHRTICSEIDSWCNATLKASTCNLLTVQGERYDGKTWLVLDWLHSKLPTLSVPVFFVPSHRGEGSNNLIDYFIAELRRSSPSHGRHVRALVNRHRNIDSDNRPWGLVIVDGLNEYLDPIRGVRHALDAMALHDIHTRGCATIITVRPKSWEDLGNHFSGTLKIREITVGPYNDSEFHDALRLHGLPSNYAQTLPGKARPLIRRPRFLGLVIKHKARLGAFALITPEVLFWLDVTDKIGRSKPSQQWDEQRYGELLRECAKEFGSRIRPTLIKVSQILGTLTNQCFAVIKDLESEGVLIRNGQHYQIKQEQLTIGIALYFLYALQSSADSGKSLTETLRDLLAPLGETDEMVAALQAAVSIALFSQTPAPILDVLVKEWLSARNLPADAIQNVKSLSQVLLPCLIRLAPESWSSRQGGRERLQEISRKVFLETLESNRDEIGAAVSHWFHMVPESGSRFFKMRESEAGRDSRVAVRQIVEDFAWADLQLISSSDEGMLSLHRVGLSLVALVPDLVSPEDYLALLVSIFAAHDSLSDGEAFILRRAFGAIPVAWFETNVRQVSRAAGNRRGILHRLVSLADRSDLQDLVDQTALPSDPESQKWRCFQPLMKETYDAVRETVFTDDERPHLFADQIRQLVRDPALLLPCSERKEVLKAYLTKLLDVQLYDGMSMTKEQHIFERTLPVTAAWFPELGKEIVIKQIHDLPNRQASRPLAGALAYHASLLDGSTAESLLAMTKAVPASQVRDRGLEEILLSLLPSMDFDKRIEAVLGRSEVQHEWTTLYDLVGFLVTPVSAAKLLEQLGRETNDLRARRIRYILCRCEGVKFNPPDRRIVINALQNKGDDRFSAIWFASQSRIYDLPPKLLESIAIEKETGQLDGVYATHLLTRNPSVVSEEVFNQLPPHSRAHYAAVREEYLSSVVREIDRALESLLRGSLSKQKDTSDLQISCSLLVDNLDEDKGVIRWGLPPDILSGSIHFRSSESTVGGIARGSQDVSQMMENLMLGSEAAAQKMNETSKQISEVLQKRAGEQGTCWGVHLFPLQLIDRLAESDPGRLLKWVGYLTSDPERACDFWAGLLHSLFVHFLRRGDALADELWRLVRPSETGRIFLRIKFTIRGINSLFCYLSDPESDEVLSQAFLQDLILNAKRDSELFEIVLGARLQNSARLARITRALLGHDDTEIRARAVRIAGWLEEMSEDLRSLSLDSSLWIRNLVSLSLNNVEEEAWAHHWFSEALYCTDNLGRWRAAQLFLACVDGRYAAWAWDMLQHSQAPDRNRGECWLLLLEAKRVSDRHLRTLKDTFLGHKVSALEAVCPPWLQTFEWGELTGSLQ